MKIILHILLILSCSCYAQTDSLQTEIEYWNNGREKIVSHYGKGYKQGLWQYFDIKGNLIEERKFVNGNMSYWNKWVNGDQVIVDGNGFLIEYYDKGSKKAEGKIKDGNKWGMWHEFYPNGEKQSTLEIIAWNGIYLGNFIKYKLALIESRDSQGLLIGKDGTGWVISTDFNGRITHKSFYSNNKMDSIHTYHSNGQLNEIKVFINQYEHTIISYHANGTKAFQEILNGDTLILTNWYDNNLIHRIETHFAHFISTVSYYNSGIKELEKECTVYQDMNEKLEERVEYDCNETYWDNKGRLIKNKP